MPHQFALLGLAEYFIEFLICLAVRPEFRAELDFVVRFRETRRAIEAVTELPDRLMNLFIKVCLNNGGRLSASKRKHFSMLSDGEIKAMEKAVKTHMKTSIRAVAE